MNLPDITDRLQEIPEDERYTWKVREGVKALIYELGIYGGVWRTDDLAVITMTIEIINYIIADSEVFEYVPGNDYKKMRDLAEWVKKQVISNLSDDD
jgi:hypothetical protein